MPTLIRHSTDSFGVGQATTRLITLLEAAGVNIQQRKLFSYPKEAFTDNTVITACNSDLTAIEMAHWSWAQFSKSHHIGFWSWELEDFPKKLRPARDLVDEVWTVSDFSADGIRENSSLLVKKVTLPVLSKIKTSAKQTGSAFQFLITFDFNSDVERKNPEAGIRAYIQAFSKNSPTKLVVKSINGISQPKRLRALKELALERQDIEFIDSELNSQEYNLLLEKTDCVVSLHRSEGYGINIIDALSSGIPVIATGYSGNMEFMTEANSMPVPFELVPVQNYAGFKVASQWAQPNEEIAAELMRQIVFDDKLRNKLRNSSYSDMHERFNLEKAVKVFQETFPELMKNTWKGGL